MDQDYQEDFQEDNNQQDTDVPGGNDRLPSSITAINQTMLDESQITDEGNGNTEGLLAYAAKKQKKNTNKTEKLSSGNHLKEG